MLSEKAALGERYQRSPRPVAGVECWRHSTNEVYRIASDPHTTPVDAGPVSRGFAVGATRLRRQDPAPRRAVAQRQADLSGSAGPRGRRRQRRRSPGVGRLARGNPTCHARHRPGRRCGAHGRVSARCAGADSPGRSCVVSVGRSARRQRHVVGAGRYRGRLPRDERLRGASRRRAGRGRRGALAHRPRVRARRPADPTTRHRGPSKERTGIAAGAGSRGRGVRAVRGRAIEGDRARAQGRRGRLPAPGDGSGDGTMGRAPHVERPHRR